jgi:hypothetical protein
MTENRHKAVVPTVAAFADRFAVAFVILETRRRPLKIGIAQDIHAAAPRSITGTPTAPVPLHPRRAGRHGAGADPSAGLQRLQRRIGRRHRRRLRLCPFATHDAVEAMTSYRTRFRPSAALAHPHAILGVAAAPTPNT